MSECNHEETTLDGRDGTEWCNLCGENSHPNREKLQCHD